ncbi:MAG: TolC family protein [Candidatus Acidiferrales bacterium]
MIRRLVIATVLVATLSLLAAITASAQQAPPGLPPPSASSSSATSPQYGGSGGANSGQPVSPAQGSYSGSVPSKLIPGVLQLSLQDAIERGLKQNLGALLSSEDVRSARGQRWQQLSALLPHLSAQPYVDVSQVNLKEFGFAFNFPGVNVPSVVGPFSYFDARAYVSQNLFDWKAVNKTRAATQNLKSTQYTYKDAHDLVVLAVGYNYLQAIADAARIESTQAQVNTAQALYNQAADQVQAGTSPAIDALRAHVQLQTQQQQLIQSKNDFAIQKLALARVIGLAPGQEFELTSKSPYQAFQRMSVDEALKQAYASRSDYQAALADVRAADFSRKAAVAGYYPTVSLNGDYGIAGQHLDSNHGVFDVRGTVTIPIFEGGSVRADILQADAQLAQSRDRLENLRGQIDADVRTALLNLQSSSDQVAVAKSNIDLAEQTLSQSRDRFAAGVTSTVEVVQAEEAVASAHDSYISSLYNYNYAKISLARAVGMAEEGVKAYFKGQ